MSLGNSLFTLCSSTNLCQTTVAKFSSERLHHQPFWYFRVVEIDNHQRATLLNVQSSQPLSCKVPYCQLRPHKTSVLHKEGISKVMGCLTIITHNNVKDDKSHLLSSPTATSSKKCEDGIFILSSTSPKQCKTGLLPANLGKNIASLVKTIRKEGEWLSDEHEQQHFNLHVNGTTVVKLLYLEYRMIFYVLWIVTTV